MTREFSQSDRNGINCPHGNISGDCSECKAQHIIEYDGQFLSEFPDELVSDFSEGKHLLKLKPTHETNKGSYYELFKKRDDLTGVANTELSLEYLKISDKYREHNPPFGDDQIQFGYYGGESDYSQEIAAMYYVESDPNQYQLFHRFVSPNHRNKNLGPRLLQQSEVFFKQLADERHEDIVCFANVGQLSVMRFLDRLGYAPPEDQIDLYQDLISHPENYISAQAAEESNYLKDDYQFPKNAKGRAKTDAVRIRFEKSIIGDKE